MPKCVDQSAIESKLPWLYNEAIIMHSSSLTRPLSIYVITLWLCISCASVDEDRLMASLTDIKDDFLSRPFDPEVCEVNVMDPPPQLQFCFATVCPKTNS